MNRLERFSAFMYNSNRDNVSHALQFERIDGAVVIRLLSTKRVITCTIVKGLSTRSTLFMEVAVGVIHSEHRVLYREKNLP